MAESIHAVVSNRQQQQQKLINDRNQLNDSLIGVQQSIHSLHNNNNNENDNNIRINTRINNDYNDNDDDDDDIDIIGRSTNTDSTNFLSAASMRPLPSSPSSSSTTMNYFTPTITLNNSDNSDSNHHTLRLRNSLSESASVSTTFDQDFNRKNDTKSFRNNSSNVKNQTNTSPSSTSSNTNQQSTKNNEWTIINNNDLKHYRNRLQRRLRYHFMSPIDKWNIKGRFPWKLLLQIIKILFVTIQVILFGNNITLIRSVDNSMMMTLHNLFLLKWDSSFDHQSIPPSIGPYAVYTQDDVYNHIDYAIKNYANITNISLGSFGYHLSESKNMKNIQMENEMSPITICIEQYSNITLNPMTNNYYINRNVLENCIKIIDLYPPGSDKWNRFSFKQYLNDLHPNETLRFDSLIRLSIKFPLHVILLTTLKTINAPRCYNLNLSINFDNNQHSGEIQIKMSLIKLLINCNGNLQPYNHEAYLNQTTIVINLIVLLLCTTSFILCLRTIFNSQKLRQKMNDFFQIAYHKKLDTQSSLHFIDGWILMITINDCLLIIGTVINVLRRFNVIGSYRMSSMHPFELDNICSALLGVGLLLVWFGILRYLTFFNQYNILLVTIKHSLSRVLRFIVCVLVLYGGFCFSGWIILGPYHFKFYTLARTSECLFALMNGDDVFATFAYLEPQSTSFVWWFSRIYLYSYVLLFIYVVLSLFIAILMDSYETIKEYYANRINQRKLRLDFTWSNDQLSRFLLADFNDNDNIINDDSIDPLSSFHIINCNHQTTNTNRISQFLRIINHRIMSFFHSQPNRNTNDHNDEDMTTPLN